MEKAATEPQLLQLRYRSDVWKMMIACILLNRTSRRQVDEVIDALFLEYPDPESMACAREHDIAEMLRPLGLSRVRATRLTRFSDDWCAGVPVMACYGIGDYARDSYRLFVLGDTDVVPFDKELKRWVGWRESHGIRKSLQNG